MLQLTPLPATPYVEQLNIGVGRRALALTLAVMIPALLLILLLAFGLATPPDDRQERVSVVSLEATEIAKESPQPSKAADPRPEKQPVPPQPAVEDTPPPKALEPQPAPPVPTPPAPLPLPTAPKIGVRPPNGQVYGPPNTPSAFSRDTERVGTAPNGEPLYAAAWYREPSDDELRGYLSTASGPGWGLIACRTAPDYRVEDCVALDEYPTGSQMNRAILAAAWQFRVRPPRLGGRLMVGSWVRIRIDYAIGKR